MTDFDKVYGDIFARCVALRGKASPTDAEKQEFEDLIIWLPVEQQAFVDEAAALIV